MNFRRRRKRREPERRAVTLEQVARRTYDTHAALGNITVGQVLDVLGVEHADFGRVFAGVACGSAGMRLPAPFAHAVVNTEPFSSMMVDCFVLGLLVGREFGLEQWQEARGE